MEQRPSVHIDPPQQAQGYWAKSWKQFRKNRMAVWAMRFLFVLLMISLFADFIANDKPIYCKIEGQRYWPIFKSYGVQLGIAKWDRRFLPANWENQEYEYEIPALIPYSASGIDYRNGNFKSPFGEQQIDSWTERHWMGTDQLGRDVAAGMVAGTRVAMMVGLIAMSIATLIGLCLGAVAGYYGDHRLQVSRIRLLLNGLGIVLAFFYAFMVRRYQLQESGTELLKSLAIAVGIMILVNLLARALKGLPYLGQRITIAADLIIMRFIETFTSIPGLLLLLALLSIIHRPSIFNIMVIIGLMSWTGIARFIRAELLRIRQLEYIEAAQAMGFSEWRILLRHAIPNALGPVLITIAFGIASAILAEAFLSFVGIGVEEDQVTWGKLLSLARRSAHAWWLAVFPGFAIFITVTAFNLIGEGLTDAIDPRTRQG
ncbi:MAG: ABC transporter permease [Bacteroidota bacterium]